VVSAEHLSREEVVAFLGGQPGAPEDLEALSAGAWSSAWAYRAAGEELARRLAEVLERGPLPGLTGLE
jgi:hypothetical protein